MTNGYCKREMERESINLPQFSIESYYFIVFPYFF